MPHSEYLRKWNEWFDSAINYGCTTQIIKMITTKAKSTSVTNTQCCNERINVIILENFDGKLSSHMLFGIHWHYVLLPLPRWQRNHIICYKYLYDHDNITVIWCTICTAHMFVTHHWPRLNHLNTRPREHNKSDWISLNRNSTKANYLVNAPKIIIFNDFMVHLFVQLQYLLFGLVTFRFTEKNTHTHTNICIPEDLYYLDIIHGIYINFLPIRPLLWINWCGCIALTFHSIQFSHFV